MNRTRTLNQYEAQMLDKQMLFYNGEIKQSDTIFNCLHPKILPLHKNNKTKGKTNELFSKIYKTTNHYQKAIIIKCGKCENCRKTQGHYGANRIKYEATFQSLFNNRENIFLTLTYDEKNAISPLFEINGMYKPIIKKQMDTFLKRLKNHFRFGQNGKRVYDTNINYFGVSELGTKTLRRHQHLIITGLPKGFLENNQLYVGNSKSNEPLYTNEGLIRNGNLGIINYGQVTNASAFYVAQYVFDKNELNTVYKCSSKNIGKNYYYHTIKNQPKNMHDSSIDETKNRFFAKLKRKSYKTDEQYLNGLKGKEKDINQKEPLKTLEYQERKSGYYDINKYKHPLISDKLAGINAKYDANKYTQLNLFMLNKNRDFDMGIDNNDFYLMRLRLNRHKRY